jgi:hypothetical protein
VFPVKYEHTFYTLFRRNRNLFIRDKPILSSERMLHKDYDRMSSVPELKILIMSLKGLAAKTD